MDALMAYSGGAGAGPQDRLGKLVTTITPSHQQTFGVLMAFAP